MSVVLNEASGLSYKEYRCLFPVHGVWKHGNREEAPVLPPVSALMALDRRHEISGRTKRERMA